MGRRNQEDRVERIIKLAAVVARIAAVVAQVIRELTRIPW